MHRQVREFICTVAIYGLAMEILTLFIFVLSHVFGWIVTAYASMWFHLPGMALLDLSHLQLLTRGEIEWWAWTLFLLLTGWIQWCVILAVPALFSLVFIRCLAPLFSRSKAL